MRLILLTLLVLLIAPESSLARGELDSEIDSYRVELRKRSGGRRRVVRARPAPAPIELDTSRNYRVAMRDDSQLSTTTQISTYPEIENIESKTFFRFSAIGFNSLSTFVGPDQGIMKDGVPGGGSNGMSGMVTVDINLFGSKYVLVETGAEFLSAGSRRRVYPNYGNYVFFNQSSYQTLSLAYAGVPVFLKYVPFGADRSSPFIRAGMLSALLVKKKYIDEGITLEGDPYGQVNDYDFIAQVGAGYNLRIYRQFSVQLEGGWFHGIIPLTNSFDVYNTGFTYGAGISYAL